MVDAGFLSIIPPIVAIVLALVTKEVIFCTKKRLRTNYLVRQPLFILQFYYVRIHKGIIGGNVWG